MGVKDKLGPEIHEKKLETTKKELEEKQNKVDIEKVGEEKGMDSGAKTPKKKRDKGKHKESNVWDKSLQIPEKLLQITSIEGTILIDSPEKGKSDEKDERTKASQSDSSSPMATVEGGGI